MKSKLLTAIALVSLLTMALPLTASARGHGHDGDNGYYRGRPAWAYQHPGWWQYQVNQNRKWWWEHHNRQIPRGRAYGWWRNHGRDADDFPPVYYTPRHHEPDADDYSLICDEDRDDCRPNPLYQGGFVNPAADRYQFPSYGAGYNPLAFTHPYGPNQWPYIMGPLFQGVAGALPGAVR